MVRRSSIIFAASLAVLSAFEPTLCHAAAAPAQPQQELEEKPRFIRKNVKRYVWGNSTTSYDAGGGRAPFGNEQSNTWTDRPGGPQGSPTTTPDLALTITPPANKAPLPSTSEPQSSTLAGGVFVQQPAGSPSQSSQSNTLFGDQRFAVHQPTPSSSPSSTPGSSPSPSLPAANQDVVKAAVDKSTAAQTSVGSSQVGPTQNTDLNPQGGKLTSLNSPNQVLDNKPTNVLGGIGSRSLPSSNVGSDTNTVSPSSGQNTASATLSSSSSNSINGVVAGLKTTLGNGHTQLNAQVSAAVPSVPSLPNGNGVNTNAQNTASNTAGSQTSAAAPVIPDVVKQPVNVNSLTQLAPGSQSSGQIQQSAGGSGGSAGAAGPLPTAPSQPLANAVSQGARPVSNPSASNPTDTVLGANGLPLPSANQPQPPINSKPSDFVFGALPNTANVQSSNRFGGINVGQATDSKGNAIQTNVPIVNPASNQAGGVTAGSVPSNAPVDHQIIPGTPVTNLYNQLTNALNTNTVKGGSIPASITSNGVLIANPQPTANNAVGGAGPSAINNAGNAGASVVNAAGGAVLPPASITSNGVLVANPQATGNNGVGNLVPSVGNNAGNAGASVVNAAGGAVTPPASITSNGVLVANPQATANNGVGNLGPSVVNNAGSTGAPVVNAAGGVVNSVTNVAGALPVAASKGVGNVGPSAINNPGQVAASITSNGILIPNPSDVPVLNNKPQGSLSDSIGAVIGSKPTVPLNQGAAVSIVVDKGSVVPLPAATNLAKASESSFPAVIPASITASNGLIVPNPAATAPTIPPGQENTAISGLPKPTNLPGDQKSTTLPDGSVVPLSQPPADKTPQSANLPSFLGSSTLSNGVVVPITASPAIGSNRPENAFAVSPPSNPSGPLSTTLPDGKVVPIASAGIFGPATGQKPIAPNTAESQPSVTMPVAGEAHHQNDVGPTTGPIATQPQVYPSDAKGPFTQKPTGYDDKTMQMVPSSILYYPSSLPTTPTSAIPTGLPSDVPLVLYPQGGLVKRPENTELIQLGFNYSLNYDFVWTHDESQRQIFTFLPRGIAYGLNIHLDNVTMHTLKAWDTTQDLHYITTLALAWIPSQLVQTLSLAVQTPSDKFYSNPDASVNTLVAMINNAIPIRADNPTDGGTQTFGDSPSASASAKTGAAPVGGNIGNSSPVKASSVAIGVGVVCGAAAYGAAMFFVARRYKKRRQSHMRSPSMLSSPVMSHSGPDPAAGAALMSGAMGGERSVSPYYDRAESRGSGRSAGSSGRQQISAPVMAENSLGWN